jgi:hypothetical protein
MILALAFNPYLYFALPFTRHDPSLNLNSLVSGAYDKKHISFKLKFHSRSNQKLRSKQTLFMDKL